MNKKERIAAASAAVLTDKPSQRPIEQWRWFKAVGNKQVGYTIAALVHPIYAGGHIGRYGVKVVEEPNQRDNVTRVRRTPAGVVGVDAVYFRSFRRRRDAHDTAVKLYHRLEQDAKQKEHVASERMKRRFNSKAARKKRVSAIRSSPEFQLQHAQKMLKTAARRLKLAATLQARWVKKVKRLSREIEKQQPSPTKP